MQATTKITLTFSDDIVGLNQNDIFYVGGQTGSRVRANNGLQRVEKGVYDLFIENVLNNGLVQIFMLKEGYNIRNPDGVFKFIMIYNGKDWYEGRVGSGTAQDPFIVHNETTAKHVASNSTLPGDNSTGAAVWSPSAHYRQICDIKIDDPPQGQTENWPSRIIRPGFNYEGGGYRISNIRMNGNSNSRAMFRMEGQNQGLAIAPFIRNLGLVNFSLINAGHGSGGIIGSNSNGANWNSIRLEQCYVIGNISANGHNHIGGLVGSYVGSQSRITDCYFIGNITGCGTNVGGIYAYLGHANEVIANCYSMGVIRATGSQIGGIGGAGGRHYSCVSLMAGVGMGAPGGNRNSIGRVCGWNHWGSGTHSSHNCYAERNSIVIDQIDLPSDPRTNIPSGRQNGTWVEANLYTTLGWWNTAANWNQGLSYPWRFASNAKVWTWDSGPNGKFRPELWRGEPPEIKEVEGEKGEDPIEQD